MLKAKYNHLVNMPSDIFPKNLLYYGDNLDVLRKHFPNNCVDLVYLDPPFNSKADYNILFKERSGEQSVAQIHAFTDFWHWDDVAERTYLELQEDPKLYFNASVFTRFLRQKRHDGLPRHDDSEVKSALKEY